MATAVGSGACLSAEMVSAGLVRVVGGASCRDADCLLRRGGRDECCCRVMEMGRVGEGQADKEESTPEISCASAIVHKFHTDFTFLPFLSIQLDTLSINHILHYIIPVTGESHLLPHPERRPVSCQSNGRSRTMDEWHADQRASSEGDERKPTSGCQDVFSLVIFTRRVEPTCRRRKALLGL